MGKGDGRSRKGKIFKKSFGKTRRPAKNRAVTAAKAAASTGKKSK